MNKFYTEFVNHKREASGPRPSPGLGSTAQPGWSGSDDPPYNANIGPGGPDLNQGAGFARVHVYLKAKQSPEEEPIKKMIGDLGESLTPTALGEAVEKGVDWMKEKIGLGGKKKPTPIVRDGKVIGEEKRK